MKATAVISGVGAHPASSLCHLRLFSGLWEWVQACGGFPGSWHPLLIFARDLPIEDQISLLKGATFELCQLRFNTVFNAETGTWECGRLSYSLEDPSGALAEGGEQPWREERSQVRMCTSWDCRAEDWAMGKETLVRQVWVLGQLPEEFTLPAYAHPQVASSSFSCSPC